MPKQLYLFDLDGVILNSRANMEAAWAEVRRSVEVDIPFDSYFALIGRPFPEIMSLLEIGDRAEEAERVFRITSMNNLDLARFYPDVEKTLITLKSRGKTLGIVTSKDELRTGAILAKLRVRFDVVQTPNERYRGKPAPDHLLAAMAETQTDPAETVYVGDMDADFEAAARAGVDYVHASWGYGTLPEGGTRTLDDIKQILEFAEGPTS